MRGLVACYEPPAVDIGRRIFALGGNVADVAIAASYAQVVSNPFMCGLSGKASIHVRDAGRKEEVILDAGHIIGSRAYPTVFQDLYIDRWEKVGRFRVKGDVNSVGYRAIMSPGFVPATQRLYERFGSGRLSWKTLLEPAVQLAWEGFGVYPQIAQFWDEDYIIVMGTQINLRKKLSICPEGMKLLYHPDGTRYKIGELLVQRDLACTIRRIAEEGPEVFYKGEIARRVAADFDANGAFVTYEDMANYPVDIREPIRITYRDYVLTANPPPGNGMIALIMLNILEGYDLARMDPLSPEYAETLARAQQCAFDDRGKYRGDPRFVEVPLDMLISKEHASEWRQKIAAGQVPTKSAPATEYGTTHVTVMDADGNTVTMTHSIGSAAGSGVVTEGFGFFHNNHMGLFDPVPGSVDTIVPGKRQGGSVPIIVFKDGEPVLAIGAAGGTRQVSGAVQSIIHVLDHGMSMSAAVSCPRLHSEEPDLILMESGWPESTQAALRAKGFRIQPAQMLGWVNGITREPKTRELKGGSEIRGSRGHGILGYYSSE